jgi:hypothetical protein
MRVYSLGPCGADGAAGGRENTCVAPPPLNGWAEGGGDCGAAGGAPGEPNIRVKLPGSGAAAAGCRGTGTGGAAGKVEAEGSSGPRLPG